MPVEDTPTTDPALAESAFVALAEAVPVPVLVTERDGTVVSANSNFRFSFGVLQNDLAGTPLDIILSAGPLSVFRRVLEEADRHGASTDHELSSSEPALDLFEFVVSASLSAVSPSRTLVVFVVREVTSGLELTRLQEKDQIQGYLLKALVHDLRTPLSAISNGLEFVSTTLPAEGETVSAEERDDLVEVIDVVRDSCGQIDQLLGDFGDFVEFHREHNPHALCAVRLEEVAEDVMDAHRLRDLHHDLELETHGCGEVLGDPTRLRRAIDNLISNAIKYSPAGGTVRVKIEGDERNVAISVSDEGLGISAEYLERIWEPFYRLRNADTSAIEGTGLGLSIVRFIVDRHEGEIHVESTPGVGTTFRVRLPRSGAAS